MHGFNLLVTGLIIFNEIIIFFMRYQFFEVWIGLIRYLKILLY